MAIKFVLVEIVLVETVLVGDPLYPADKFSLSPRAPTIPPIDIGDVNCICTLLIRIFWWSMGMGTWYYVQSPSNKILRLAFFMKLNLRFGLFWAGWALSFHEFLVLFLPILGRFSLD